jgi:uncharacterized protein
MPTLAVCPNPACAARCTVADDLHARPVRCPRCQRTFVPSGAAPPAAGKEPVSIGRYRIRSRLGSGAFGTVYRAYDPKLDREVALKVLRGEVLAAPKARERFQREARSAAKMFHPNIVPVFDTGGDGDRCYIASAFIAGLTLGRLARESPPDPRRAAGLVVQLLDALAYAHKQGVLHRDIKPDNCLVDDQGRLYLTDFGLAASLEQEGTRMTREGAVMGTPAYMAPEQALGDLANIGPAADQYAAAVVLYELLTGRTPFEGPTPSVLYQAVHTPPPRPTQLRPGLDGMLEGICLKALAKRKEDRFPDCAVFAGVLRSWLAAQPAAGGPPAAPPPQAPPANTPTQPELVWYEQETLTPAEPAIPYLPTAPADPPKRPKPKAPPRPEVPYLPTAEIDPAPPRPPAPRPAPPRRKAPLARTEVDEVEVEPEPSGGGKGWVVLLLVGLLLAAGLAAGGYYLYRLRHPPVDGTASQDDRKVDPAVKADADGLVKQVAAGKGGADFLREQAPKRLPAWRQAADAGFPEGQLLLGLCYVEGAGVEKDGDRGLGLLRKAADKGFAPAQNALGSCYEEGNGTDRDPAEAARWYRKAADQGFARAQYNLGFCYRHALGVPEDLKEATNWFRKAADLGDPDAQDAVVVCYHELGMRYNNGEGGFPADAAEAVRWYRKAADLGHAESQYRLGLAAFYGNGLPLNQAEGFGWYLKAAEQGHTDAQNNVGYCYHSGLGVPKDYAQAVDWFRRAADQGNARARSNLALCYQNGNGVPRDLNEAIRLYRLSADEGYAGAQYQLGLLYYNGDGVPKDVNEAARLYRLAADQGNADAQYQLGFLYFNGQGVPENRDEAIRWWTEAADQGHEPAKEALKLYGKK